MNIGGFILSNPVLSEGRGGAGVKRLSRLLVERGFLDSSTNTFDNAVRKAVKDFQARHLDSRGRPLSVDGVVGPLTWWALENADNRTLFVNPPPTITLPRGGGSARGRAALQVAIDEINDGSCEIGVNNSGRYVTKYLNGLVVAPANWCAGFASWCFDQHEDGCPWNYSLGARDIRTQFRRRGWLYQVDKQLPAPGDLIFWWREQPTGWKGHIGIVHQCADGIVYVIEGNKGGFPAPVRRYDYVLGRIDKLLGFGRVP